MKHINFSIIIIMSIVLLSPGSYGTPQRTVKKIASRTKAILENRIMAPIDKSIRIYNENLEKLRKAGNKLRERSDSDFGKVIIKVLRKIDENNNYSRRAMMKASSISTSMVNTEFFHFTAREQKDSRRLIEEENSGAENNNVSETRSAYTLEKALRDIEETRAELIKVKTFIIKRGERSTELYNKLTIAIETQRKLLQEARAAVSKYTNEQKNAASSMLDLSQKALAHGAGILKDIKGLTSYAWSNKKSKDLVMQKLQKFQSTKKSESAALTGNATTLFSQQNESTAAFRKHLQELKDAQRTVLSELQECRAIMKEEYREYKDTLKERTAAQKTAPSPGKAQTAGGTQASGNSQPASETADPGITDSENATEANREPKKNSRRIIARLISNAMTIRTRTANAVQNDYIPSMKRYGESLKDKQTRFITYMNRQKILVENTVNAFTISMAWKGKKFITVKSDLAKSIVEQSSAAQTTGKLIKKTIDLHYSSLNGARDHSLKALDQYQQLLTKIKSTSEPLMREMIRLEVQYKEAGIKAGAYIGKEEQERMKVLFEKISTQGDITRESITNLVEKQEEAVTHTREGVTKYFDSRIQAAQKLENTIQSAMAKQNEALSTAGNAIQKESLSREGLREYITLQKSAYEESLVVKDALTEYMRLMQSTSGNAQKLTQEEIALHREGIEGIQGVKKEIRTYIDSHVELVDETRQMVKTKVKKMADTWKIINFMFGILPNSDGNVNSVSQVVINYSPQLRSTGSLYSKNYSMEDSTNLYILETNINVHGLHSFDRKEASFKFLEYQPKPWDHKIVNIKLNASIAMDYIREVQKSSFQGKTLWFLDYIPSIMAESEKQSDIYMPYINLETTFNIKKRVEVTLRGGYLPYNIELVDYDMKGYYYNLKDIFPDRFSLTRITASYSSKNISRGYKIGANFKVFNILWGDWSFDIDYLYKRGDVENDLWYKGYKYSTDEAYNSVETTTALRFNIQYQMDFLKFLDVIPIIRFGVEKNRRTNVGEPSPSQIDANDLNEKFVQMGAGNYTRYDFGIVFKY